MSRPQKPIDWKKVDELLMAGCHGTEIAPHFDIHVNTFYDKVMEEHKIGFTEYSAIKRAQGDSLLRHVQFSKAVKGDISMLVWLGKNRLRQREREDDASKQEKITIKVTYDGLGSGIRIPATIVSDTDNPRIE